MVSGARGGMPWKGLGGTLADFEVRQTPLSDVVSGAEKDVRIVYPKGGSFWNEGNVCRTTVMQSKHPDHTFKHPGGYSGTAIANWSNG